MIWGNNCKYSSFIYVSGAGQIVYDPERTLGHADYISELHGELVTTGLRYGIFLRIYSFDISIFISAIGDVPTGAVRGRTLSLCVRVFSAGRRGLSGVTKAKLCGRICIPL